MAILRFSIYFQTDHKQLFRAVMIPSFPVLNFAQPFSEPDLCLMLEWEYLFDFPHCFPTSSSINNSVSCQHFPSLQPHQAGKQANLQGATGWGLPPGRRAGALSSPRHRQGAQRSPPAAQTICALRSFSATPSLRNLLAAFLTVPYNVPPRLPANTTRSC